MKAGLFNTNCIIMRKRVISGDYRDKEIWENHYETKCNFVWNSGSREIENREIVFSNVATVTLRAYVDVQEEDHLLIRGDEWRILALNRQTESTRNCILLNVEKVNK